MDVDPESASEAVTDSKHFSERDTALHGRLWEKCLMHQHATACDLNCGRETHACLGSGQTVQHVSGSCRSAVLGFRFVN